MSSSARLSRAWHSTYDAVLLTAEESSTCSSMPVRIVPCQTARYVMGHQTMLSSNTNRARDRRVRLDPGVPDADPSAVSLSHPSLFSTGRMLIQVVRTMGGFHGADSTPPDSLQGEAGVAAEQRVEAVGPRRWRLSEQELQIYQRAMAPGDREEVRQVSPCWGHCGVQGQRASKTGMILT